MSEINSKIGFSISLTKLKILLLYFIFFIIICIIYIKRVMPEFSYYGSFILNINILNLVISTILIFVFVLILPSRISRPSDLFLHIQFIFPVYFMLILFCVEDLSFPYVVQTLISFFVLFSVIKIRVPFIKTPKIKSEIISSSLSIIFIILLAILIITHIGFFNLNLNDVYKYRFALREIDTGIFGYIWLSFFPIVIGILLAQGLINRDKLYVTFITIACILIFGLTSHKFFLFLPWAIIGFYWILKRKNPIIWLLMGLIALSIMSLILDKIWLNGWATGLVIHRVFLVPSQLNYFYYDFFLNNEKIFWTDSKWLMLGEVITYPYDMPISRIIGGLYLNNYSINANTGWLAMGYSHAGFFGMAIYAFMIGLVLKFIDYRAKDLGNNFVLLSFFPIAQVIFDSVDLKTAFLTNGLALYLVLLSIYGKPKFPEYNVSRKSRLSKMPKYIRNIRKRFISRNSRRFNG